ncbi:MAG: DUF2461 domain-containing protein [Bacteroidota bacterium]
MLKKSTIEFLSKLKDNNNRLWLEKNKKAYTVALEDVEELTAKLILKLQEFDTDLIGLNPHDCVIGISREAKTIKDKKPLKVFISVSIIPENKRLEMAGYYLQIQPGGESFVAGGLWQPEKEPLFKVRQEIAANAYEFKKILNARQFKISFGLLEDHQGKTIPKEFSKGHPEAELLKYKSFIVSHAFDDKEIMADNFIELITEVCLTLYPLNKFINEAIKAG